jgi:hypothetical protein
MLFNWDATQFSLSREGDKEVVYILSKDYVWRRRSPDTSISRRYNANPLQKQFNRLREGSCIMQCNLSIFWC